MKSFIIILAAAISFSISMTAQTTATWLGGKPGRPTDWNCAANWKEGKTPNEFAQVIIPADAEYYPVIKDEIAPIDALLVEGGSSLTIQNGSMLTVLGETGRFDGITLFGKVFNNGLLEVENVPSMSVAFMQQIQGLGSVESAFANLDSLARGR